MRKLGGRQRKARLVPCSLLLLVQSSAGPVWKAIAGQEEEALAETAKTDLVSHASVTIYHGTCDNLR